ncbi:MAG: phosphotransferase [Mizugakiibacter sp.]|uniref:phosphotransferase enzyme family protein n=1 Tax=Mizugakiibacter sp. TaxID=1972610 RepID=UPI0031C01879|nr:phosphotransferase [Xanthomonadaceae bacterium]
MNDPSHRVHGLAGDSVAPDWPALTGADVAALLRGYPRLGPPQRIVWHSPRPLSAACLVETASGVVFVKRHHRRVRSPATLGEEHRFMAHLRDAGVPVPAVLADAQGRTAVASGDWVYEVHAHAAGLDLYREAASWSPLRDRAHAHAAGHMLATLHDAAASYRAPQRDTHMLVARAELIASPDPVAALRAQLPARPGLADYLRGRDWRRDFAELLAPWHAAVQPRLARQAPLWTHNDWHGSNLCWSGADADARISAVFDFGLAARNFALFDLATAIERNAIAWLALDGDEAAHADIAGALIAGYRQRRPLDAAAIGLLAGLLPLVHVDFALSEVEYFHAVTQARANADVAYDTFLRGHAAWFGTPPGQALLQAIRDCA